MDLVFWESFDLTKGTVDQAVEYILAQPDGKSYINKFIPRLELTSNAAH